MRNSPTGTVFPSTSPRLPLYTEDDALRALKLLRPVAFDATCTLPGGANAHFVRAGHILGAASIVLEWGGARIVFSGDIGRYDDPLMPDPQTPARRTIC